MDGNRIRNPKYTESGNGNTLRTRVNSKAREIFDSINTLKIDRYPVLFYKETGTLLITNTN